MKRKNCVPSTARVGSIVSVALVSLHVSCGDNPASRSEPASATRAIATSTRPPAPTTLSPGTEASGPTNSTAAWSADLDLRDATIGARHSSPFWKTSETRWSARINELKRTLPNLDHEHAIVELIKLVALLDTHSGVLSDEAGFRFYPFALYEFSDGVFFVGAKDPELVGSRLTSIGGMPITKVLDATTPLVNPDNNSGVLYSRTWFMICAECLHGIGITTEMDHPGFTFERPDGTIAEPDVSPIPFAQLCDVVEGPSLGVRHVEDDPCRRTVIERGGHCLQRRLRIGTGVVVRQQKRRRCNIGAPPHWLCAKDNYGNRPRSPWVVGYYLLASSGGTGPAGPPGPPGPPGPAGPAVASVIWVATSGGQYTSVRQALASITDNGPGHRYLVMVGPGTYVESSTIDLKDYVDLQGSGQDVTTIICNCAATLTNATIAASGLVHSELRNLTVTNSGGGNGSIGVSLTNVTAAMSIVDTTITASNASPFSGGFGLYLTGSVQPHLDALNVYINIIGGYAVYAGFFGNIVVVRNSWIYSTAGPSVGAGGSLVRLVASTVNGSTTGLSGRCDLVVDVSGNPFTCN